MTQTMETILSIRDRLVVQYKNHENIIMYVLKFILALILFGKINSLGYCNESIAGFAGSFVYTLALSVVFAVAPPTAAHLVLLLAAVLQVSMSMELAIVVALIGVCVLVFYCRLEPKKSYIISVLLLAFYFRMPYAVVLFAGLYVGFSGIIPVAIGTAIWNFLPMFKTLAASTHTVTTDAASLDVAQFTESITDIYTTMQSQATSDLQWIFTAFIFAMVIVMVSAVSRLTVNYAKELAVILGGFLCIFGSFVNLSVSGAAGVGLAIFFTLLSVALVLLLRFFDVVLDYKKVEHVEFEDEENYYYVKIVNKLGAGLSSGRPTRYEERETGRPASRGRKPATRYHRAD